MEEKKSDNLLEFPIQYERINENMTAQEALFQVQLSCTQALNRVHSGEEELTKELMNDCIRVNEICLEHDYPLMQLPF